MPPAATACTSDSGASASATTYNSQPDASKPNPISHRRFPSSERTDAIGRRSDSGGTFDATLCSSR